MKRIPGLAKKNTQFGSGETKGISTTTIPQLATTVEHNVKPKVVEAQQVAAETSVSGRYAVSRGTIFLAFYLWILSGAIMISLLARFTDFFPGDRTITRNLQKQQRGFRWDSARRDGWRQPPPFRPTQCILATLCRAPRGRRLPFGLRPSRSRFCAHVFQT